MGGASIRVYYGRDVLSRLKRGGINSEVPVLVHSCRSSQPDRHVALELGAVDYIDKPVDPRFMLGKIRRLIDAAREHRDA